MATKKTTNSKAAKKTSPEKSASNEEIWSSKKDLVVGKESTKGAYIAAIVGGIVIVLLIIIGSVLLYLKISEAKRETSDLRTQLEDATKNLDDRLSPIEKKITNEEKAAMEAAAKKEKEKASRGSIEGSLGYPSNYIPKTMSVCAENSETKETTCTDQQLLDKKYSYGIGYKLEVAPGTYTVYAKDPSWGDYKAYYSDFVACGLTTGCGSHNAIEIKVETGKTTDKVDPVDWYNK